MSTENILLKIAQEPRSLRLGDERWNKVEIATAELKPVPGLIRHGFN